MWFAKILEQKTGKSMYDTHISQYTSLKSLEIISFKL